MAVLHAATCGCGGRGRLEGVSEDFCGSGAGCQKIRYLIFLDVFIGRPGVRLHLAAPRAAPEGRIKGWRKGGREEEKGGRQEKGGTLASLKSLHQPGSTSVRGDTPGTATATASVPGCFMDRSVATWQLWTCVPITVTNVTFKRSNLFVQIFSFFYSQANYSYSFLHTYFPYLFVFSLCCYGEALM